MKLTTWECRMEVKKVIHDMLNFFLNVLNQHDFYFFQRLWWKMESLWVMESLSTNPGKRQKSRNDISTVTKFLMNPWGSPIASQGSQPLPSVLGWWVNLWVNIVKILICTVEVQVEIKRMNEKKSTYYMIYSTVCNNKQYYVSFVKKKCKSWLKLWIHSSMYKLQDNPAEIVSKPSLLPDPVHPCKELLCNPLVQRLTSQHPTCK